MTVSLRPPDSVIPVPVGPAAAPPDAGAWLLLLSVKTLSMSTQHEWVWVILEMPLWGHAPFWGAGASLAIWVFVSNPSWLLSNFECEITIAPPEFVPE